jgi:hypothetical protein
MGISLLGRWIVTCSLRHVIFLAYDVHLYCLFHPLFIVFYCRNFMIFKLSAIVPLSSYFDYNIDVLFILSRFMLVVLWVNRLTVLSRLSPWIDGTDDTETGLFGQRQGPM